MPRNNKKIPPPKDPAEGGHLVDSGMSATAPKIDEPFRELADAAPVLMWRSDASMNCTWVNRSWLTFTGRTLEQELNKGWIEGIHPDDAGQWSDANSKAFNERREFEIEYRLRRHDGEYRWMLDRGSPIKAAKGELAGYIGTCTEIHDRKQVEFALRQSEERFKNLADGAPVFIWMMGEGGNCDFANMSFLNFFGGDRDSVYGSTWQTRIHDDDLPVFLSAYERAFNKREVLNTSLRIRRGDNEWRWIECHASPRFSPVNGFSGFVGTGIDVTDRMASEEISVRYRLLSEQTSDVIWFTRGDGSFIDVNKAATERYGYSREEFLAMNVRQIRHQSTLTEFEQHLSSAKDGGTCFETLHISKDGTVFPVEVRANPSEIDGEVLVMAIVRDISERKTHEIALRESEERRQMAQEAGRVGIFDWDRLNGLTYWSETMWQLYGEKPGDANPDDKFWLSHLHPKDRDRVKQNVGKVLSSRDEQFNEEFRIVHKDGTTHWIEVKARIQRDGSGTALRMYGVNLDITERKEAEQKTRLNENQLSLVMNTIPALISYVDNDERYRFVNGKLTDWFARSTQTLIGRKVRDVIGVNAYRLIKPHMDEALAGKDTAFEAQLLYRTVGPRFVHSSFVPDVGVDGIVHGYYELTRDLTDIKRSEELLKRTEDRLGLLMDSLTDHAIFSMDIDALVDSWNKGAEIIFGYTQQEIIGRSADILFTPEDREARVPEKERRNARRKGRALDQRWHVRKDGSRFFADGLMLPLYIGDELAGYSKIASDLTDRKRRDEELQRAREELEDRVRERTTELVASNMALVQEMEERQAVETQRSDLLRRLVSSQEMERRRIARDLHDQLGQRLTALRLKIASLKEATEHLDGISVRVQRLQEIAEKLDSEVSFLAWELRPSALDDLGMAEAIEAFVLEWSRHYDISADFRSGLMLDERLPRDTETHLYRITQEALNNIAKHAFANHVSVLLESREQHVILIIEDDGKGFDPASLERPRESGRGLGLLGMQERAALIGGDVEIESAPGRGTTIYVRVPITYKEG